MSGALAYVVVIAVSALITALGVPIVRRASERFGLDYEPHAGTVHTEPISALGGVAMFVGVIGGTLVARGFAEFGQVFSSTQVLGVLGSLAIAFGVGLIDDLRDISPPAKLAGLVLAGSVLTVSGVSILYFRIPFLDLLVLSPDLSALFTVVWLAGMCNAINFIDGLDGLAGGIVAIASAAFLAYAQQLSHRGALSADNPGPLAAALALGVCVGFLVHNIHPASIMMGDGGALMLGAMMASSTIAVGGNTADPFSGQSWFFFAPLIVPLLILGVPLLDTVFSIVRRAASRSGVSQRDKKHLHHRLMSLGHGHRRTVIILWAWTALLSGVVLLPVYTGRGDGLVVFALAALGLVLYSLLAPRWSSRGGAEDTEDDDQARSESDSVGDGSGSAETDRSDVEDERDRRTSQSP